MNQRSPLDMDRVLGEWIVDAAAPHRVAYLDEVFARTSRTRQRPAWTFPARWLPELPGALRVAPVPAWMLLLLALLVALLVGTLVVGSLRRLPSPYGLAANGLVAFDAGDDIVVARADGSMRRVIASTPAVETSPIWSPDGTHLAFWRALATGRWAIVVVDPTGANEAVIPVSAPVSALLTTGVPLDGTFARGAPSLLVWSPTSDRLAFSQDAAGIPTIWVAEADGSRLARIGDPRLPAAYPDWLPDGKAIVFRGGGDGDQSGVYVMDEDGRNIHEVYRGGRGTSTVVPTWQPGGDRIAFSSSVDGSSHMLLVRADGTGLIDVSVGIAGVASDYWPKWSPDGARLAFQRSGEDSHRNQFIIVNADGSNPTQPHHPLVDCGGPVWSPDGRTLSGLLYDADTGTDFAIVSFEINGEEPPVVVPARANTGGTSWQRVAQ